MRLTTISRSSSGFTLVELATVLILVGVLAVFAVPRFFNRDTFDTRVFIDDLQSLVRFGQKTAVAQNRPVYVVFGGASTALCFDAACNSRVQAPASRRTSSACQNDGNWMCIAYPSNVTGGVSPSISGFYFNALGRPFNIGNTDPNSTFARTTFTISGGGLNQSFYVERETGYVHK